LASSNKKAMAHKMSQFDNFSNECHSRLR
jgi:hypothetical protein